MPPVKRGTIGRAGVGSRAFLAEIPQHQEYEDAIYDEGDVAYVGEETVEYEEGEAMDAKPSGMDDDDDEPPPTLEPEEGPAENPETIETRVEYADQYLHGAHSPGGTQYQFIGENEDEPMYVEEGEMQIVEGDAEVLPTNDLRTVEFNFLDNKHICCGLCGEIVPYDLLLSDHLPTHHPDVFGSGHMDLEEIPYDTWLKDKLYHERKSMENGFRSASQYYPNLDPASGTRYGGRRTLRRVSQVRVNPAAMTLQQLDIALRKKMVEKMGRKVKVSLVDKQHARCGICNAVVSLNKKFEIVHLVRHFNAWHPSTHRCTGSWLKGAPKSNPAATGKPLSMQDFAVVDVNADAPDNLQCIWCGTFMTARMLAMHFTEVHPDEVEVPKCNLCLQEIVINARLLEKFGEDFQITLPDEHHLKSAKLNDKVFSTESALDKEIDRRLRRMQAAETGDGLEDDEDDDIDSDADNKDTWGNSRMTFGRRNKPKRTFIQPSLRQAIPQDSQFVEAITEGEWKCKVCNKSILAAVISAGAIKHFRLHHPEHQEEMQYELCKARLERISDGCMEFVHPQLVECLICNLTYALHKPYNMCRGVRHLKTKHPEMMPEYNTDQLRQGMHGMHVQRPSRPHLLPEGKVHVGEVVDDPTVINRLKREYDDLEFEKVQTVYGPDGEEIILLVPEGEVVNEQIAHDIQNNMMGDIYEMEDVEEGEGEEAGEGELAAETEEFHPPDNE